MHNYVKIEIMVLGWMMDHEETLRRFLIDEDNLLKDLS